MQERRLIPENSRRERRKVLEVEGRKEYLQIAMHQSDKRHYPINKQWMYEDMVIRKLVAIQFLCRWLLVPTCQLRFAVFTDNGVDRTWAYGFSYGLHMFDFQIYPALFS